MRQVWTTAPFVALDREDIRQGVPRGLSLSRSRWMSDGLSTTLRGAPE
jgi:hypothetical protein